MEIFNLRLSMNPAKLASCLRYCCRGHGLKQRRAQFAAGERELKRKLIISIFLGRFDLK